MIPGIKQLLADKGYDTDASYIKTPGSDRRYDDGGLSGASLDRPALQKLLADVGAGKINIVVVYKVDRLTRSLADFPARLPTSPSWSSSSINMGYRSCRSPRRSTPLPAWAGSRSTCCSPLPSSSAR